MSRKNFEDAFEKKAAHAAVFHAVRGSSLYSKVQRVLVGGYRYVIYSMVQKFGVHQDTSVQLFWGKSLVLPLEDIDTKFLYYFGHLGYEEESLIRFFIKHLKPEDIFYDVGANYGFYTHLAGEILSEGECHAFEPNKNTFSYLSKNFSDLEKSKRIQLNNSALSDTQGEIVFFSATEINASGISTTSETIARMRGRAYSPTKVEATTLDVYLESHAKPTVMKIDVEGGELAMLKGARNFLSSSAPIIALEVIRGEQGEVLSRGAAEYLVELGYVPHRLTHKGEVVPLGTLDFETMEHSYGNWIFTKHP